jgi:ribosomal protein L20A (L18A)
MFLAIAVSSLVGMALSLAGATHAANRSEIAITEILEISISLSSLG